MEISHNVEELGMAKSCKESAKTEKEMYKMSESMEDDAKVDDGD